MPELTEEQEEALEEFTRQQAKRQRIGAPPTKIPEYLKKEVGALTSEEREIFYGTVWEGLSDVEKRQLIERQEKFETEELGEREKYFKKYGEYPEETAEKKRKKAEEVAEREEERLELGWLAEERAKREEERRKREREEKARRVIRPPAQPIERVEAPPAITPSRMPLAAAQPRVEAAVAPAPRYSLERIREAQMVPRRKLDLERLRGAGVDLSRLRNAGDILANSRIAQLVKPTETRVRPTPTLLGRPTTTPTRVTPGIREIREEPISPQLARYMEEKGYEKVESLGGIPTYFWIGIKQGSETSSNALVIRMRTGRYGLVGIGDKTGKPRSKISYGTVEEAIDAAGDVPEMKERRYK